MEEFEADEDDLECNHEHMVIIYEDEIVIELECPECGHREVRL